MNDIIFGVRIEEGGAESGVFDTFDIRDIFYIDLWSPKKNYRVPRFHTRSGIFTVLLTLETCERAFTHLVPLDSNNLVNIENIKYVTETPFVITAFFEDGSSANVARYKKKIIEHLIKRP